MNSRMRTSYFHKLNKKCGLKFPKGYTRHQKELTFKSTGDHHLAKYAVFDLINSEGMFNHMNEK